MVREIANGVGFGVHNDVQDLRFLAGVDVGEPDATRGGGGVHPSLRAPCPG